MSTDPLAPDPLAYVLSCLRRAADNSYPWSLTPTEAGAVVAEVERLRAERHLDNADLAQAYDFARDKGSALERGVVLDYLAYRIEMSHYGDAIKEFINARDEIAEGVHHTIDYEKVIP